MYNHCWNNSINATSKKELAAAKLHERKKKKEKKRERENISSPRKTAIESLFFLQYQNTLAVFQGDGIGWWRNHQSAHIIH
jgi:hypothetical protein